MQMFTARPRLKSVHILAAHGMEFTDKVLLTMAGNCRNIRDLTFRAAPTLTDAGITAVAQGCPNLCFLEVGGDVLRGKSYGCNPLRAGGTQ
jgi:hypothetical protein